MCAPALLEREERGVEAGEAVGVCHRERFWRVRGGSAQTSTGCVANLQQRVMTHSSWTSPTPRRSRAVYDEQLARRVHRGVADPRQRRPAQDVVQDVFLRAVAPPDGVRRRARRARLLPAADGALARARPVARGAGRRPRVRPARRSSSPATSGARGAPVASRGARGRPATVRAALGRLPGGPARGARARLLGRADRRPDRAPSACRWARPRAASGSGWPGCAPSAATSSPSLCDVTPKLREQPLATSERPFGHAEPRRRIAPAGRGTQGRRARWRVVNRPVAHRPRSKEVPCGRDPCCAPPLAARRARLTCRRAALRHRPTAARSPRRASAEASA